MIHCNPDEIYKPRFVFLWMLLSLKAGYLNAAGFLATGNYVSHVTGFGTQIGYSISHEDYLFGAELLIIPISFIFGSSVPSWILDWNFSKDKPAKFHYVQFLITLGLAMIFIFGVTGNLGDFSTEKHDTHDIIIVGILCLVCGMKNGLTTWATGGKIRTTHLTGLSTDIGLNLPKLFSNNRATRFPESKRVNYVRILTFLSFSTGSLVSAFIFPRMEYAGFVFPFITSLGLSILSYISYKRITAPKRNVL